MDKKGQCKRPLLCLEVILFFMVTQGILYFLYREYTYEYIKKLIEKQQEQYHWEFLFLGANIDAIAEASKLGIAEKNAVRYKCDKRGTNLNFDSVGIAMSCIRKNREIPDEWAEKIREYCEKK